MQNAVPEKEGLMIAVLGLKINEVNEFINNSKNKKMVFAR